jgi:hypothetical protein
MFNECAKGSLTGGYPFGHSVVFFGDANPPSSPPGGQFTATAVIYAPTAASSYYSTGMYSWLSILGNSWGNLIITWPSYAGGANPNWNYIGLRLILWCCVRRYCELKERLNGLKMGFWHFIQCYSVALRLWLLWVTLHLIFPTLTINSIM